MMNEVMKDWLPITKRNRVAWGFAVAAMLIFQNELGLRHDLEVMRTMAGWG